MNTLRTFIVFAILAAVGYGVYATLTHQPPPPPPEVAEHTWHESPHVELPGSGGGMPAVGGPPVGGVPVGAEAGGNAPAFGTPLSAATEGAPVPLQAEPHQPAPGEVGSVATADSNQQVPPAAAPPYADFGPPNGQTAPGAESPYGPAASATPDQPGYPSEYPLPAGTGTLPTDGAPPYPTERGTPTAGSAYGSPQDQVAAPEFSVPGGAGALPPGVPPAAGQKIAPTQDPAALAGAAPVDPGVAPGAAVPGEVPGGSFDATFAQLVAQLDQGRLADVHLELSRWYLSPQLSQAQRDQVHELLDRLAGTVVYSQESLLEPPYEIQPGDNLERVAKHYEVPWQLLAKINGVSDPQNLRPGDSLKVIRGPFNATVDMTTFKLTLWLGERYAGSFPIGIGRDQSTPAGTFQVVNKQENPAYYGRDAVVPADDPNNPLGERWIDLGNHIGIHGTSEASSIGQAESRGCIRLSERDVEDVYDILGVGSSVVIRR